MTGGTTARWLVLLGLGLATVLGARPAPADEAKQVVTPYLKARDERAVGEVAGQAHGDPPRPALPPVPLDGVSVLLLPYSSGFEKQLDDIKQHLRDSLATYMEAVVDVTAARTVYEQELLAAGGGELIRGEVSDGRGVVKLPDVPAGDWLLLAWRVVPHPAKSARARPLETKGFRDIPMSAGYAVVTYWRMRVEVRPGETAAVALHDRNVWMTGVREDLSFVDGGSMKRKRR